MDPFTLGQVQRLFDRLQGKVLIRVIIELSATAPVHPNLDMIRGKLHGNAYATPFDFALDVRQMFIQASSAAFSNRVATLAIADLSNWFETHLHKLPRSPEEEVHYRLTRGKAKIQAIRRAMSLAAARPDVDPEVVAKLGPRVIHHAPTTVIAEIQQLLAETRTPEVQVKLMAIVRKHFPNLGPVDSVTLPASDISSQCAEEMRGVLKQAQEMRAARDQEPESGE
jgi:hypothetical protein